MTVAYATVAELTEFIAGRTPPDDAARLLARASELVDEWVRAPYTIDDTTKLPTDPDIAAVLRDATCAVVEAWMEVGEDNDIDGLAGAQIAVQGYSGPRAPAVPPRVKRILANAGLLTPAPSALAGIYPGGSW